MEVKTFTASLRPTTEVKPARIEPKIDLPKNIKSPSKNAQPKEGNIVITISISKTANKAILRHFEKQGDKSRLIEEAIKQKYPEDFKTLS
jgi:hypothetical protein